MARASPMATAISASARPSRMAPRRGSTGGCAGPRAAAVPHILQASAPVPATSSTVAMATPSEMPVPRIRASTIASAGTVASDRAVEYVSRSARPSVRRRKQAQK